MILQGDCLDHLEDIDSNSVDLILTDPPYFLPAQHYDTRKQFKRNFSDLGILESFFKLFFKQVDRVLKQDGFLLMFCDGQSYPLFYYHAYFIFKTVRPLIWDKKVSFNGYYFRHQHELILFAIRPQSKPIPTGEGDILRYNAVKVDKRIHPAEKPLDLIKHLIERLTNEGDTVLDPFLGSGTTYKACQELNRKCIGIEINTDYLTYRHYHRSKDWN